MTELNLYVREARGRQVSADVTRAIAEVDANLPVISSQSFEDATAIGLLPQRLAPPSLARWAPSGCCCLLWVSTG